MNNVIRPEVEAQMAIIEPSQSETPEWSDIMQGIEAVQAFTREPAITAGAYGADGIDPAAHNDIETREIMAMQRGLDISTDMQDIHFHDTKTQLGFPEAKSPRDLRRKVSIRRAVENGVDPAKLVKMNTDRIGALAHKAWVTKRHRLPITATRKQINEALNNLSNEPSVEFNYFDFKNAA